MAKREHLSKRLRFEVFKRDSFKCQYCGRSAPEVLLHVDHITPVSKGGTNDILNLVTACADCNLGKGARRLDDNNEIRKAKKRLDELNARREQLRMMMEWRRELQKAEGEKVNFLCSYFEAALNDDIEVNDCGKAVFKRLLNTFTIDEICVSIDISINQYVKYKGGEATMESMEKALSKLGGICHNRKKTGGSYCPEYVAAILSSRLDVPSDRGISWTKYFIQNGVHIDTIKEIAVKANTCSEFLEAIFQTMRGEENAESAEH